ncbi:amidohydrolase family protein [Actinacidiphila paucisporea]|uniref:Imidazolonepropionase n=1 Tax=Actinacidiphila paucisporea TaxID=310782 RepID=A0A1M7NV86_9ACTN|nr:amidohydrolase family protein [Actinacidiphila paucisporea]SHN08025.1 Imidazolonepropionase [Actinacidiphila paucisporea]
MTRRVLAAELVLPGGDQEAVPDGAVLVDGDTIADVGPRDAVIGRAPAGTPVQELGAATLLPGLIDCHVHLVFDASEDPLTAFLAADDAALLPAMVGRAARLLDAGVTTARDLGDRNGLVRKVRDAITAGDIPGPRLLSAGTPVTVTGGHCWFLGGEADGQDAVRAAVRRNLRDGADLTKIMVTGGTMTTTGPRPHQVQFTAAELAAAVEESARFGRRVAAHVHGTEGIEAALEAGADTLEHCTFASAVKGQPAHKHELIDRMAADGVFVCPTFSSTLDSVARERGADTIQPYLDLVRREYEAGVRLVAGTDAGVHLATFEGYAEGLLWYERAGLPVDAVLKMATSEAAAALGVSDRTGRIAPGLDADLLVVPGDLREDLRALRDPLLVLARGRVHVPPAAAERAVLRPQEKVAP